MKVFWWLFNLLPMWLSLPFVNYFVRRSKVRIIYKGGATQTVWCKSFSVSRSSGETRVEWDNVWPRPLLFGIDDLAAVYQVR